MFPQQASVTARLQDEINRALASLSAESARDLARAWAVTRRNLQSIIVDAYKSAGAGKPWTLATLRSSGAEGRMRAEIKRELASFKIKAVQIIKKGLKGLRRQSALRHAWLLDQVTPPSRRVRIPNVKAYHEAGIVQQVTKVSWVDRWSQWVGSYSDALSNNLVMGATNESSLSDAIDEVDATTVNTPRATLSNAMNRLFAWEAQAEIALGEDDVVGLNEDLVDTEVWKTSGRRIVCDDCDANEGLTVEETDGDIPLHPNCDCFWLIVPASYAELLRSGDAEDQDLADLLQARGTVPEALAIRGEDGKIAAKVIIDFSAWSKGQPGIIGEI